MKKIIIILIVSLMYSCSNEKESKSLKSVEKLRNENGKPVEITTLEASTLSKWEDYSGNLEGIEQVNVFSMLSDKIEKVMVNIGDKVYKDQKIAKFDTENPQAKFKQAEIGFEIISKTYQRMKKIYTSGGISKQKLDEIESKYNIAKENYRSSKNLVNIKAPISGIVTDIFVDQGEFITLGKPICKISDTSKLKVTIFIKETEINNISKGDSAKIQWDGSEKKIFWGKISKIALSADSKKRGFPIDITIDNKNNLLKPGIFVNVYIKLFEKNNIIKVPRNSIIYQGNKKFVFIVNNGISTQKEIVTGLETGTEVEIKSGLKKGDSVIIKGQTLLNNGDKIQVIE